MLKTKLNAQLKSWLLLSLSVGLLLAACGEEASSTPSNKTTTSQATATTQAAIITGGSKPANTQAVSLVTNGPTVGVAVLTPTPTVIVPTPTTKIMLKPAVQPKVVKSVNDSKRTITFTEQPNLTDGSPAFLWFDAEG